MHVGKVPAKQGDDGGMAEIVWKDVHAESMPRTLLSEQAHDGHAVFLTQSDRLMSDSQRL